MTETLTNTQSKFITLSGYRHHYAELGEGDETLLLVHGFSASLLSYQKVMPAFAKRYRVLAIDLVGFGASDKPTDAPYSLELFSKLLVEFLEKMNATGAGKKVYAVGHSMGGKILLAMSVLYPNVLSKLVVTNTDGFLYVPMIISAASLWGVRHLLNKVVGRESFVRKTMESVYFDPAHITDEHFQRNLSMVRDQANFNAMMALNRNYKHLDLRRTGLRVRLGELKLPVLILWGDSDRFVATKYAAVAHREIPNSELQLISRCGHVPMVERPEEFVQLTLAFLEKTATAGREK
ncbi:MAG: alpha/beta hydrolase [Rhizobacter sp.]|nr:alpha/beta hydrolase [Chlorobiales bacterium]